MSKEELISKFKEIKLNCRLKSINVNNNPQVHDFLLLAKVLLVYSQRYSNFRSPLDQVNIKRS